MIHTETTSGCCADLSAENTFLVADAKQQQQFFTDGVELKSLSLKHATANAAPPPSPQPRARFACRAGRVSARQVFTLRAIGRAIAFTTYKPREDYVRSVEWCLIEGNRERESAEYGQNMSLSNHPFSTLLYLLNMKVALLFFLAIFSQRLGEHPAVADHLSHVQSSKQGDGNRWA